MGRNPTPLPSSLSQCSRRRIPGKWNELPRRSFDACAAVKEIMSWILADVSRIVVDMSRILAEISRIWVDISGFKCMSRFMIIPLGLTVQPFLLLDFFEAKHEFGQKFPAWSYFAILLLSRPPLMFVNGNNVARPHEKQIRGDLKVECSQFEIKVDK